MDHKPAVGTVSALALRLGALAWLGVAGGVRVENITVYHVVDTSFQKNRGPEHEWPINMNTADLHGGPPSRAAHRGGGRRRRDRKQVVC
jgi:hypothetical protein